jgi:transglutaminase-like putative cysteine protease
MTAGAITAAGPAERPRFRWQPAEGWISLFATFAMVLMFAASLIEAGWLPESIADTRYLLQLAIVGVAFGFIGAKLGWGRWRTHIVGALFAGLFIPLIVGGLIIGGQVDWDPRSLAERLVATFNVAQIIWTELVIQGRPFTSQYAHYHLIFSALVWGAGMLAGYTVFGHRRPLDAVVVVGLAILANMAITEHDQLWLLVIFSASALLLLVRTHVFEEQATWLRRRIGEPETVGQLYLTSGAGFVMIAILGAVLLTFTAASAPLQGLWADLPRQLQGLSQVLAKIAPPGGNFRPLGVIGFGDDVTTQGVWQPSDRVAYRAFIDPVPQVPPFKWRAGTYAQYTTVGWKWGDNRREDVNADAPLVMFSPEGDAAVTAGRRRVNIRVTPDAFRDPTVMGPNMIGSVDRPSQAVLVGADGWFSTLEARDTSGTYSVDALLPVRPDQPGGLNEARLRAAGTAYSDAMRDTYLALPPGSMGPESQALLEAIVAAVPRGQDPRNPYDLARTMETYLRDPANFTYQEDVRPARNRSCGGISTVECFAIIKQGYCEYYASTMAVLLRTSGVPARVVYGFLPTDRGGDGVEVIRAQNAHWWVEVYFPGIGWFEFDPTGGGRGQPQPLPSGSLAPSSAPSTALPTFGVRPSQRAGGGNPTDQTTGGTGIGPFIAIALILAVGIVALAYAAWRRAPRKPMAADQAWGSLARLATRFGLGPRASQTVYEYAGALGEAVPTARVEVTTLARAKVETAYGGRDLGADRLKSIGEAYHRLRIALLGVILRRGLHRPRRRRP